VLYRPLDDQNLRKSLDRHTMQTENLTTTKIINILYKIEIFLN